MTQCRTLEETFEKQDTVTTLCGDPVYAIWDNGASIWDPIANEATSFWDLSGQYGIINVTRSGNAWTEQWD